MKSICPAATIGVFSIVYYCLNRIKDDGKESQFHVTTLILIVLIFIPNKAVDLNIILILYYLLVASIVLWVFWLIMFLHFLLVTLLFVSCRYNNISDLAVVIVYT